MKMVILACCIIAIMLSLTGCKGSGSSESIRVSGGAGIIGGDTGGGIDGGVNPEPATVILLSSGFAAYAFLRRKKK